MNIGNALGFLLLGLGMTAAPAAAPEFFPATAIDGSSTRALWLQVMGVVQVLIGLTYVVRHGTAALALAWDRLLTAEPRWETAPVPASAQGVASTNAAAAGATLLAGAFGGGPAPAVAGFASVGREAELQGVPASPRWVQTIATAQPEQRRFVHALQRLRLLAQRHRDGAQADRAAALVLGRHVEDALMQFLKTGRADLENFRRTGGESLRTLASGSFLREFANEVGPLHGDTRRAA